MLHRLAAAGVLILAALPGMARAQAPAVAPALPPHAVVSDETTEKRRSVGIRIENRLDEADALKIASAVHARSRQPVTRTYVNFYLPGAAARNGSAAQPGQGPWASVLFAPSANGQVEPKFFAHGLKRDDEEALVAEYRADTRPLLGSWLTSPPAAPGRLTIYSDGGRVFAEWRLRNGQKTVDELQDTSAHAGRRFEVVGGGHYVLTRTGDLELWSGTTLIAIAERIRAEPATPRAATLGRASHGKLTLGQNKAPGGTVPATSLDVATTTVAHADAKAAVESVAAAAPATGQTVAQASPGTVAHRRARARDGGNGTANDARGKQRGPQSATNGDQIAAKLSGAI